MDPTFYKGSSHDRNLGVLIEAASKGDLRAFELLHNLNGDAFVNSVECVVLLLSLLLLSLLLLVARNAVIMLAFLGQRR